MAIGWHAVLFEDTRVTQQRKKELWSNTTLKLLHCQKRRKKKTKLWQLVSCGSTVLRAPGFGKHISPQIPGKIPNS